MFPANAQDVLDNVLKDETFETITSEANAGEDDKDEATSPPNSIQPPAPKTTKSRRASTQNHGAALEVDTTANAALQICRGFIGQGKMQRAAACMVGVIDKHPRSTAAERARASLDDIRSFERLLGSQIHKKRPDAFPEGRLEFTSVAGAFGILSGTAPAMFLAAQAEVPGFLSAAGGGAAVVLGGGFALGSYLVAEKFNLDYGQTKTLQSGVVWGIALGLALSPWVSELAGSPWHEDSLLPPLDFEIGLPAIVLTSTLTGYLGLAASAAAVVMLDLSPSQVSMINTGATVGVALGFGVAPLVGLAGFKGAGPTGLVTTGTLALGLLGGWGMSKALRFEVWEVLLIDGVTILGGGLSALVAMGIATVGGTGGAALGGLVFVLGTGATLGAATAGVGWMRTTRGDELSRIGMQDFEALFAPTALLDQQGNMTPMLPLIGFRF
ncbi:MAG: hypothetical protein GY822_13575 [Deltaproteobacteria bacterium]|nr:hypothetical protein [Deltaproteobacteria bacterium]